jgi:hypothetical protein
MDELKLKDKNDKEFVVKLKPLLARQRDKLFNMMLSLSKGDVSTPDVDAVLGFVKYIDESASELTGLSAEVLDELPSEEKDKIIEYYQSKVLSRLDFLKSSLNVPNSVQKEKAGQ